jgi:hypothetical protein
MSKIECKIEAWWISSGFWKSAVSATDPHASCCVFGDIYGHPDYRDGAFVSLELLKADFVSMVVETDDAYIKLAEPQSLDRILCKLEGKVKK